jgi:hypothetical protein
LVHGVAVAGGVEVAVDPDGTPVAVASGRSTLATFE